MKNMLRSLLIFCCIGLSQVLFGQDIPSPMDPPRLVNDFAGVLTAEEGISLEKRLVTFNNETSTQITFVSISDLQGYAISDFAFRLGEKWGVGQEGFDNGIVIVVKPKTSSEKGEIFIATGYGLEGAVPDVVANRIVRAEILPSFRNGDYLEGLDKAITVLFELTRGEYSPDEYMDESEGPTAAIGMGVFIFIIFIISLIARTQRSRHYSPGHRIPLWTALFLASSSGRSHSGSFGNFSSGGGGFGGFGGGSFGGGGAGGSW